jgi:hypothetical protein
MNVKNVLLGVSLASFLIGFSNLQENLFFWMGKPIGAIFFILYFILMVLEREYAIMDKQTQTQPAASTRSGREQSPKNTTSPALTTAAQ